MYKDLKIMTLQQLNGNIANKIVRHEFNDDFFSQLRLFILI
jgi:hypothetical protein